MSPQMATGFLTLRSYVKDEPSLVILILVRVTFLDVLRDLGLVPLLQVLVSSHFGLCNIETAEG